jgi:hypothetical protein
MVVSLVIDANVVSLALSSVALIGAGLGPPVLARLLG